MVAEPEVIIPVTVSGDVVHGVSSEVTLGGIFGSLVFNHLGDVAFSAFLVRDDVTNFDSDAILRLRAGGELAAIARQGVAVPGAGNDVVFGNCVRQASS
jgi:hypothetical protein